MRPALVRLGAMACLLVLVLSACSNPRPSTPATRTSKPSESTTSTTPAFSDDQWSAYRQPSLLVSLRMQRLKPSRSGGSGMRAEIGMRVENGSTLLESAPGFVLAALTPTGTVDVHRGDDDQGFPAKPQRFWGAGIEVGGLLPANARAVRLTVFVGPTGALARRGISRTIPVSAIPVVEQLYVPPHSTY